MNKLITLFLAIICSTVMLMPLSLPSAQAEAAASATEGMRKKRQRYRKRALRVQVGADITPWSQIQGKADNFPFNVDVVAGYNFGYFEIGPNVHLNKDSKDLKDTEIEAGLWGEFNFIKNTRKQKLVPALGLKVNYKQPKKPVHELLLSPYLTLKYFPASRTGLVLNVDLDIVTPFSNLFAQTNMGVDVSLSYVHYFHL